MKKLISYFLILLLIVTSLPLLTSADEVNDSDIAIVFTHDLHSHIDSFMLDGSSSGGFQRIKTVIDEIRDMYKNTIVVDGGDFSMGTLFQTAFSTSAIEYRMMGYLGYEATTFGNHEFDYGFDAVKEMISVAKSTNEYIPPILCANINTAKSGYTDNDLSAMNIKDYEIFKKGDYIIAVFGVLGRDAAELSSASNLVFDDFIETAKITVDEIDRLYSPDLVICLSHSGTGDTVDDEDIELAKKVEGIDIIISGHTHTTLNEPIIVNDTIIASCGEYGENVGKIIVTPNDGKVDLISYSLVKIDDAIPADKTTSEKIKSMSKDVDEYLEKFGYSSADQVLAYSPFDFPEQSIMSDKLAEQPLGNLISDSYIHAIKSSEGDNYVPVDVAVVPVGVIRASIDKGHITVSQVYEISSLGIGNDGVAGYPLCSVYLYGSELWSLAEIDASVSGIMSYAQLYCSGLGYSVNTNRMFMNRVYDCWLIGENGERIEIEKDKLYRVVSGLTSAEMLGTVKEKSFGLLELTPKDFQGNPITDFNDHIATSNGTEIKEWKALADYLASFPEGDTGVSTVPMKYASTMNRKIINAKFSFNEVFCNWNYITWVAFAVVNAVLLFIIFIITAVIKRKRKNKARSLLNKGA